MDYEKLLDKAYENLPDIKESTDRFKLPKVTGHVQGNKTIISNLHQIAQSINRPIAHLFKYLLKELAAPGELKSNGVILGSKISASRINEKIEKYVYNYVICKQCNKPDTKLKKEGTFIFMKCMACGAKTTIKRKKD